MTLNRPNSWSNNLRRLYIHWSWVLAIALGIWTVVFLSRSQVHYKKWHCIKWRPASTFAPYIPSVAAATQRPCVYHHVENCRLNIDTLARDLCLPNSPSCWHKKSTWNLQPANATAEKCKRSTVIQTATQRHPWESIFKTEKSCSCGRRASQKNWR
jgi:hypothetical protein